MDLSNKLTIVIPCKNEKEIIDQTLTLLNYQTGISGVTVIVCDSSDDKSTNKSLIKRAKANKDKFDLLIIKGGLPSVARNNGFMLVETQYVLFMDADMFLVDNKVLNKCIKKLERYESDLITCKVRSTTGEYNYVFRTFDIIQKIFKPISPFCLGGFMLFRSDVFMMLGGFDETARVAEDYLLSKQIHPSKFKIHNSTIFTSPRRFKNKGIWYMTKLMASSFLNRRNSKYFQNDKGYWV